MDNVNRLRIGLFAPGFVLKDSEGNRRALSDFRGKKNLVLLFCPGRRNQLCLDWLKELNRFYDQIRLKEAQVLSLSPDESWISHRIKQENKIQFPILKIESDLRSHPGPPQVIQQYGLQRRDAEGESLYPAVFLVDQIGIIRYRKVYIQPSEELNVGELLCELDKLT